MRKCPETVWRVDEVTVTMFGFSDISAKILNQE